jgi:hypothetical protein
MPMVLCAAKSYLAQAGNPEKPADLASHSWLEYSVRPDNEFEIIAPEGISTRLIPQGRFVTNDPMTLVRWLTAGVGIAYVPLMWAIEEINRGELEILLPSYQSDPRPVYALYTEKDKLPLKVQVCINYLTEYFVDVAKIYQGCTGAGSPGEAVPGSAGKRSGSGGAADGKVIDFQRRLADAHRHALALFTADADAVIQLQIVTHHRNLLHGFNPGANQRRPFTAFVTFPFSIR